MCSFRSFCEWPTSSHLGVVWVWTCIMLDAILCRTWDLLPTKDEIILHPMSLSSRTWPGMFYEWTLCSLRSPLETKVLLPVIEPNELNYDHKDPPNYINNQISTKPLILSTYAISLKCIIWARNVCLIRLKILWIQFPGSSPKSSRRPLTDNMCLVQEQNRIITHVKFLRKKRELMWPTLFSN